MAFVYIKRDLAGDPSAVPANGPPPVPVIENIHKTVYDAANNSGALQMDTWHYCESTHCRAGWVVTLAGEAGKALESFHNTELAAMLIYRKSSSIIVEPWKFYVTAPEALADMKRCADEETAGA